MEPQAEQLSCEQPNMFFGWESDCDEVSEHMSIRRSRSSEERDNSAENPTSLSRTSSSRTSGLPTPPSVVRKSPPAPRNERTDMLLARSRDSASDIGIENEGLRLSQPNACQPLRVSTEATPSAMPPKHTSTDRLLCGSIAVADPAREELSRPSSPNHVKIGEQLGNENLATAQIKRERSRSLSCNTSNSMNSMVSMSQQDWDSFQVQLTELNKEATSLREELKLAREAYEKQATRATVAETRATEAERRGRRTMKELAQATRIETNSFDDKFFADEVKKLRFDIFNWARNQDWEVANENEALEDQLSFFGFLKRTCYNYKAFPFDGCCMSSLIESYVWQFFMSRVFGHYVWTSQRRRAENKMYNPFKEWKTFYERNLAEGESLDLLQDWRVANVRLLLAEKPAARNFAVAHFVHKLLPEMTNELIMIACGELDLKTLREIAKGAIELDILMQQQRPQYVFDLISEGSSSIRFNKNLMKIRGNDEQVTGSEKTSTVNLVIQPGLWKLGNSAGRKYDQKVVILKTVVDISN